MKRGRGAQEGKLGTVQHRKYIVAGIKSREHHDGGNTLWADNNRLDLQTCSRQMSQRKKKFDL